MASLTVGETKKVTPAEEIITSGSMVYVFTDDNQLALYEGDRADKKSLLPKGYTSLWVNPKKIPHNPLAGMTGGEDVLRWTNREDVEKEEVDEAKYRYLVEKGWILKQDKQDEFLILDKERYDTAVYPFCAVRGNIEDTDRNEAANTDIVFEDTDRKVDRFCAVRELQEEAGIKINANDERLVHVGYSKPRRNHQTHIYLIRLPLRSIQLAWDTKNMKHVDFTNWRKCPHSGLLKVLDGDYNANKKMKSNFETSAMILIRDDVKDPVDLVTQTIETATLDNWELVKAKFRTVYSKLARLTQLERSKAKHAFITHRELMKARAGMYDRRCDPDYYKGSALGEFAMPKESSGFDSLFNSMMLRF